MVDLGKIRGCGIGLRREFLREICNSDFRPDWFEITPENWISMPFEYRNLFKKAVENTPLAAHGLSLSIGSPGSLNYEFLKQMKEFLDEYSIEHYSEHLSFSEFHGGQTYELLPVPMTEAMAVFIAEKLKDACDFLERKIIMENATYYYKPYSEISETEFINMVTDLSDCPLLLDVNNVYVNSVNHGFNPREFIDSLNLDKVAYIHIAGHSLYEKEQIVVDTHGKPVIDEVWNLLEYTLNKAPAPVLLERDNNVPPLNEIITEYNTLKTLYKPYINSVNENSLA